MTTSTLDLNIRLGNAERQLRGLRNELGRVDRSADKAVKSSRRMESGVKELRKEVVLLASGYAALAVALSTANTFRVFEQAIANLGAITGATGEDLEFLADASRNLGKVTTLSASEVAEAFKLVASAKPDLLNNLPALEATTAATITLAEAAGTLLPEAAAALGNSLNQFGAGAESAGTFINVLAAGAKFGASSIRDTTVALRDSGTTASAAGISFEALNATIQQLSLVGLRGSRAGSALRNIILKLQTEGVDKLNPAVVGLSRSLQNLAKENRSVTELVKLFGLENINAAQALLDNADNLDILQQKLTGTNIAYEQAATNTDTLDGSIKRLNSAFEEFQLTIGQRTSPALRGFVDLLTDTLLRLPESIDIVLGAVFQLAVVFEKSLGLIIRDVTRFQAELQFYFESLIVIITKPIITSLRIVFEAIRSVTNNLSGIVPDSFVDKVNSAADTVNEYTSAIGSVQDAYDKWGEKNRIAEAEYESLAKTLDVATDLLWEDVRARNTDTKALRDNTSAVILNNAAKGGSSARGASGTVSKAELRRRKDQREAEEAFRKSLQEITKETMELENATQAVEKSNAKILEQYILGFIPTWDIAQKKMETQRKAILGLKDESEELNDITRELGFTFTSAFEDAIVTGGKLSDVLKGLGDDLLRIITRKGVTEPLGNALSSSLAGVFKGFSGENAKSGGILDIGASSGKGFLSGISDVFGSFFGGFANGGSFTVPASSSTGVDNSLVSFRATPGETVTVSNSAQRQQRSEMMSVDVQIVNNGTPQNSNTSNVAFDGAKMVIEIVTEDIKRGGQIASGMENTFGVRRGG